MFGKCRFYGNPGMSFGFSNNQCGCGEQPIIEPTINKCVEREFCHEVPHVFPFM